MDKEKVKLVKNCRTCGNLTEETVLGKDIAVCRYGLIMCIRNHDAGCSRYFEERGSIIGLEVH